MTLHILSAIIEKCPRDLSLYIAAALGILETILQSNDITLVEYSVPAFETLCTHQEHVSLTSEKGLQSQFEVLLRSYASYASSNSSIAVKSSSSLPLSVRYRKAGLQAIRGAVPSIYTWAPTENLINLILPVVLENLDSQDPHYIEVLRDRVASRDEIEKDFNFKRKQSMSTVWTADTIEADPQAASGTIEDADKLAEEEVGMLALQTLRILFTAVNRSQLRWVTSAMLRYILTRTEATNIETGLESRLVAHNAWPIHIIELSCEWARVQDRFTVLVTTVESLTLLSSADEDLRKQLILASLVESLLCSSINFIGLSVMDVLAGLMQDLLVHLRKLESSRFSILQSRSSSSGITHNLAMTALFDGAQELGENNALILRAKVVGQLRKCIAGLATHVYYSDQISDMISVILGRLKPSLPVASTGVSLAVQYPAPSSETYVNGTNSQERPQDRCFPPGMGRFSALLAVKEILNVANTRIIDGSYGAVSRSKVAVAVWEGTEWLLRDVHARVRSEYVDSLLSWLDLELGKEAMRLPEEGIFGFKHSNDGPDEMKAPGLSRRALSTILHQDGSSKRQRRRFLRSLHLAIYEIALQQADSETNILLLHLLLVKMVENLGVNALRDGLPMMMRLQDDIQVVTSLKSKIQLASLVYGYLQAICSTFDIESNSIGREIHGEIARRKEKSIWMERITLPPQSLERIQSLSERPLSEMESHNSYGEVENLKPFEHREQLIDRVSLAYSTMLAAPPSSPTGRMPNRSISAQFGSASASSISFSAQGHHLPSKFREELLSDWTKEACLAHATHESSRSGSLNGSRSAANANSRDLLAVAIPSGNVGFNLNSPALGDGLNRSNTQNNPHNGGLLHSNHSHRRPSTSARQGRSGAASPYASDNRASGQGSPLQLSTSSFRSSVRVEDLKRALSTSSTSHNTRAHWRGSPYTQDIVEDTASESMISAELSNSDTSAAGRATTSDANTSAVAREDSPSTPRTPQTSHPPSFTAHGSSPPARAARELPSDLHKQPETSDDVPPVPPLPASLQAAMRASLPAQNGVWAVDYQPTPSETFAANGASGISHIGTGIATTTGHISAATSVHKSRSAKRLRASSNPPAGSQRTVARSLASSADFSSLLESIHIDEDVQGKNRATDQTTRRTLLRPPY